MGVEPLTAAQEAQTVELLTALFAAALRRQRLLYLVAEGCVTAAGLFASRSAPDWQAEIRWIARSHAASGCALRLSRFGFLCCSCARSYSGACADSRGAAVNMS